jgi:hypothetical protein
MTEWTLVVALAGIALSAFLGWLNYQQSKEARQEAAAQAREAREHEAATDRETRLWDQRKAVYVEILEYTYRLEDLVHRTEPIISFGGDPPPPEWPKEDDLRAQSARTAAWGSPALLAKLLELKDAARAFQGDVWLLRAERDGPGRSKDGGIGQWQKVEEQRKLIKALVKDVVELAGRELRGEF